jgi:NAD-dependent dihydropyrimidine dehydrogenase PreA subunit
MSAEERTVHYVCTLEEARVLVAGREHYWVSNCGCREGRGACGQSRMDVCLYFEDSFPSTGSGRRAITREDVDILFKEAREKLLVPRPFRDEKTLTRTAGICFCCADCCGYFLNPAERCETGKSIESTAMEACTQCGDCVEVCHFKARTMREGTLVVDRGLCYGCGLCADACPAACIGMVKR